MNELNFKYTLVAMTADGSVAPEFIMRKFKTIKDAIAMFDAIYNRQGFVIKIYKLDSLAKTVKSTYR